VQPPCKTIPQYFASFGIKLHRTIATDDILAKGIVEELNLRGVKSDSVPVDKDERDDVALVSEWDTLYGRALPEVVERKLAKDTAHHHNWIHNFSYLKGLDGLLPSAGKDDTRQDNASDQEKQGVQRVSSRSKRIHRVSSVLSDRVNSIISGGSASSSIKSTTVCGSKGFIFPSGSTGFITKK